MDAPRAHAPGHDSDRILVFGAGPAVGWGVASHELALPGTLAREVTRRTRRGSDVDLTADSDMTAANAVLALTQERCANYDAVVVILGVNDALALTAPDIWRAGLSTLLTTLLDWCSPGANIVVVGIHPIRSIPMFDNKRGELAQRHAGLLNRETERICAEHERTSFVSLPAASQVLTPDRHRTPQQYVDWAGVIADSLVPLLTTKHQSDDDRRVDGRRLNMGSEEERQAAVDRMSLAQRRPDVNLQRIVAIARRAFKTESAMITVLDHERQWHLASSGKHVIEVDRTSSFCELAIHGQEAMVVRDAQLDGRFHDYVQVAGEPHIRFYAGFPIETPSGERIGALCVLDQRPRQDAEVDVTFLRELAHMVQRELWRGQETPGGR